jgi:hypothetical protein
MSRASGPTDVFVRRRRQECADASAISSTACRLPSPVTYGCTGQRGRGAMIASWIRCPGIRARLPASPTSSAEAAS